MTGELSIRNRQRLRAVEARLLRELTLFLLNEEMRCTDFELCVHLVTAKEMAQINETFLHHAGSTDVITFDHSDRNGAERISGEIFISLDDTVVHARRFRVTWQEEVARYLVHGLLHLSGYEDQHPAARQEMKAKENRLVRALKRNFSLRRLGKRKTRSRG